MWCYQKPGFQGLLLAELQRQQQCSQFCDTMLQTEGVSVPAHSCVLAAISPHISSALSSAPSPPAGQRRLLEFRALRACTLLRVVRLLYSGEMAGEGEAEKQEAVSAAASLGIHGLVEVTRRDLKKGREGGELQRAEVGVQTEAALPEENGGRYGRCRREVRDGSIYLWKEIAPGGEKDTGTQTEELQVHSAPPAHPAASFETIDLVSFQSLGQTTSGLPPTEIPYIPVSFVYPLDGNQTHQPASVPVDSLQGSTAAGHESVAVITSLPPSLHFFSSQVTPCAAFPQELAGGVSATEDHYKNLERFQGNIPGFINYFLKPEMGEHTPRRGRPRGRRQGARTGRRGRGSLTHMVAVQEVGVSRLQKQFLKRWGMRPSRTGKGGGAAGRKLYLKTRELLKAAKGCQRRRARFSPYREGWGGNIPRVTMQPLNQEDLPLGRSRRTRAKPPASLSSSPPMRFSSTSLQPSPAASYMSPALSLIHTTPLPPLPPPPPLHHEEQPEHIERLLEEVMMGLDILPNSSVPHLQPLPPATNSSCNNAASGNALAQNNQQSQPVAGAQGFGSSSAANDGVFVLPQQGEGALNDMLENFLLSFEQHTGNCPAGDEAEMGGQSCTDAPVRPSQMSERQDDETKSRVRRPRSLKASASASARSAVKSQRAKEKRGPVPEKQPRKRRKNECMLSLEKKKVRLRKTVPPSDTKAKMVDDRGNKQLQQMAVVMLERCGPLPASVTLQSLDFKSFAETNTTPSSVKCGYDDKPNKNRWATKMYPIRSRFKQAHLDSTALYEVPLVRHKKPPSASQRRQGRPRNAQLLRLSENSAAAVQPQHVEPFGTMKQAEENQEIPVEKLTVQLQEDTDEPTGRGENRGAEAQKEICDGATGGKRVCFEQMPRPPSECAEPTVRESEDIIDVETVSMTSSGGVQREEQADKPLWNVITLREAEDCVMDGESSGDEIIDVEGDVEDDQGWRRTALTAVLPPAYSEVSQGATGSWDEDEGVMGESGPVPDELR